MCLVQKQKLGDIDLTSDTINFIEIHHLVFENVRAIFSLDFIISRSFGHGAYTIYDMTPQQSPGVVP